MKRTAAEFLAAAALCSALTVLVTWPHIQFFTVHLYDHYDVPFSIWRLAWVGHALSTSPADLLNGNIFHPAERTLLYSDAMLVQGVLAMPLFRLQLSPTTIYNTMLFAGFVGSGLGAFVLARHLTGALVPALAAAAAFTVAPYRIEHVMHLELQWAMWIPLTFWALHVACERSSIRYGALAGAFFALQVLSCVYYGVFLAMTLVVFVPALLALTPHAGVRRNVAPLGMAAVLASAFTLPLLIPYIQTSRVLGARPEFEITLYSATLASYFAAPTLNLLWGWTANLLGSAELRLFPGLTCLALAAFGIAARKFRRPIVLYLIVALVAIGFSFGWNNPGYRLLAQVVTALQGFRSLSRFAIIANCAIAVLAAFGAKAALQSIGAMPKRRILTIGLLVALIAESIQRPMPLMAGLPPAIPDVYRVIRGAPAGAVMELPLPRIGMLPGFDPTYEAWAIWHWKPLVNGYSGYYPRDYIDTMIRMEIFPEPASINRLRAHDVRYIIVHRALFTPDRLENLMVRFKNRSEFKYWGAWDDPVGTADVFELLD